ncbi:hypothetical protein MNEG_0497 [Monoraphidium neglectum]|uniref:Uncharacterized protein n=1 Tax=Monoraphidium neglectum TaxID=145388 RepID=A0A0D2KB45_9CHLO|nr:hypothetical protein MNEG_0497 [Monoraphidium neglectum]KIZ07448.1 hypothetical protein MNEG_0497 [Monoraphidium neglectum]|eukprot:XP_013906467.1 hypothetical protein MNEG_0497 [Monoraphidium neglectum]
MTRKGKLGAPAAGAASAKLAALTAASLKDGYDREHGGVFESGAPGHAPGTGEGASTKKAYLKTRDTSLLNQLSGTFEFVRAHIYDPVDGEWVWQTDAGGGVIGPYYYQKGNVWKASYHNLRAMLFMQQWIKEGRGA